MRASIEAGGTRGFGGRPAGLEAFRERLAGIPSVTARRGLLRELLREGLGDAGALEARLAGASRSGGGWAPEGPHRDGLLLEVEGRLLAEAMLEAGWPPRGSGSTADVPEGLAMLVARDGDGARVETVLLRRWKGVPVADLGPWDCRVALGARPAARAGVDAEGSEGEREGRRGRGPAWGAGLADAATGALRARLWRSSNEACEGEAEALLAARIRHARHPESAGSGTAPAGGAVARGAIAAALAAEARASATRTRVIGLPVLARMIEGGLS